MKLNATQKEILFGIALGDAHFETQNKGISYRIKFEQSLKHEAYLNHLYVIFKDFCKTSLKRRIIKYKNNRESINIRFATVSHTVFTFYGKQFYKDKKKIVPKLIHRWLTPRALAYWYMDDGSMKSTESKGVLLNTQGFSYKEILRLCEILTKNFNLSCWPRKQKNQTYQIYISGRGYEVLRKTIYNFIIPEMRYKFPLVPTTKFEI